jgi:hypothetical protein
MIKNHSQPFFNSVKANVMYKDGTNSHGYFHAFDDYDLLRREGKYRFIPEETANALKKELEKTKAINKTHSIVINIQHVADIELVRNS